MYPVIEWAFWMALGLLLASYGLYPATMLLMARLFRQKKKQPTVTEDWPVVAVLVAVHNAGDSIIARLENLLCQGYPTSRLKIFVGADGCTDATEEAVRAFAEMHPAVQLRSFARTGKAGVLEALVAEARAEHTLLAFTDARVQWSHGTLQALLTPFRSQQVKAVSGMIEPPDDSLSSTATIERAYILLESSLKAAEAQLLGGFMGAMGPCYAVRVDALPVPLRIQGVDDFYISMIALGTRGKGMVANAAVAHHNVLLATAPEMHRKRRFGLWGAQLLVRFWHLLYVRGLLFGVAFLLHKVVRWLGPFLLLVLLVASAALMGWRSVYSWLFAIGIGLVLLGLVQILIGRRKLPLGLGYIGHPVAMQGALLLGWIDFFRGRRGKIWQPTQRQIETQQDGTYPPQPTLTKHN